MKVKAAIEFNTDNDCFKKDMLLSEMFSQILSKIKAHVDLENLNGVISDVNEDNIVSYEAKLLFE